MSTPLVIPEGFNDWPRLEQIEHYLKAGLKIHPCYGPHEECNDPGKQPRWTIEQRLTVTPDQVMNHFRYHPNDNVGMVPYNGHASLDLDSIDRLDKNPMAAFRILYPKLYDRRPFVLADRGDHVPLFVPDVPIGVGKIEKPGLIPGLNLEIFLGANGGTANIVMPPSVHKTGHRYNWGGFGEEITIYISPLYVEFGFNTKEPEAEQHENNATWRRQFKGDLRSLDMFRLCQNVSLEVATLEHSRLSVQCLGPTSTPTVKTGTR
jgi:hypothetical protein